LKANAGRDIAMTSTNFVGANFDLVVLMVVLTPSSTDIYLLKPRQREKKDKIVLVERTAGRVQGVTK